MCQFINFVSGKKFTMWVFIMWSIHPNEAFWKIATTTTTLSVTLLLHNYPLGLYYRNFYYFADIALPNGESVNGSIVDIAVLDDDKIKCIAVSTILFVYWLSAYFIFHSELKLISFSEHLSEMEMKRLTILKTKRIVPSNLSIFYANCNTNSICTLLYTVKFDTLSEFFYFSSFIKAEDRWLLIVISIIIIIIII